MRTQNDRNQSGEAKKAPATRKRFRIERLEERIAPKRGGKGSNNCGGGGGGSNGADDTIATSGGGNY